MEIELWRKYPLPNYTIGKLNVRGSYFCDTLEDTDRGLDDSMSVAEIMKIKIKGKTAIPKGRYQIKVTYSPKYKRMMPILCNVKGFQGIRIHSGNTPEHTEGCLLLGENTQKGMVLKSRYHIARFYKEVNKALARGEEIWITIR